MLSSLKSFKTPIAFKYQCGCNEKIEKSFPHQQIDLDSASAPKICSRQKSTAKEKELKWGTEMEKCIKIAQTQILGKK